MISKRWYLGFRKFLVPASLMDLIQNGGICGELALGLLKPGFK
jgi:hypothetical protein